MCGTDIHNNKNDRVKEGIKVEAMGFIRGRCVWDACRARWSGL
jgi:hypothetical protein